MIQRFRKSELKPGGPDRYGMLSTAISLCLALSTGVSAAQDAEFYALGDLAGGEFRSDARAVSDDGSVVVGRSDDGVHSSSGFFWSMATGMQSFRDEDDAGRVYGPIEMTPDGQFITGVSRNLLNDAVSAFRWSSDLGFERLEGIDGQPWAVAEGISASGAVVVGTSATDDFSSNSSIYRRVVYF